MFIWVIFFEENVRNNQRSNFILLFGSVGYLLFGSIGYGIYTTVGPSSQKLRDTIQEHTRMHELGIANGNNGHNHNEAQHIHWEIWMYLYFFDSELTTQFFFISILSGAFLSFFIFLLFWLTNQNAMVKNQ